MGHTAGERVTAGHRQSPALAQVSWTSTMISARRPAFTSDEFIGSSPSQSVSRNKHAMVSGAVPARRVSASSDGY